MGTRPRSSNNIRNCDYVTENDYVVQFYNKTYNLKELESVDFIVFPFNENIALAHTMLSFGFGKGQYLVSSAEGRFEKGESYSAIGGSTRQYELMYVLADERDMIRLRTEIRDVGVYIYRSTATPAQARALFVDILQRMNQLKKEPEFYDTLTNNCTSNIVRHVNHLFPGTLPTDYRALLPGFSPQLAYELGLLDKSIPFEELKRRSHVNELAHRYKNSSDFSDKIRQTGKNLSSPRRVRWAARIRVLNISCHAGLLDSRIRKTVRAIAQRLTPRSSCNAALIAKAYMLSPLRVHVHIQLLSHIHLRLRRLEGIDHLQGTRAYQLARYCSP